MWEAWQEAVPYLDDGVRVKVHRTRGLVQEEDAAPPHQRPRQTQQLALAAAEVVAALGHLVAEAPREGVHGGGEVGFGQRGPQDLVRVTLEGVEVQPDRAAEQHRVLGGNGIGGEEGM